MGQLPFSVSRWRQTLCMLLLAILLAGCGNNTGFSTPGKQSGVEAPFTSPWLTTPTHPNFRAFVGTWISHGAALTFAADGHAKFIARAYQWCGPGVAPPCDSMQGNRILSGIIEEMAFTQVTGSIARGTITTSSTHHTGARVSLTLKPNNMVSFSDGYSTLPHLLCGHSAPPGACGA